MNRRHYVLGQMVWVCHQNSILKGIVREGPTLSGQYRVCLVDVPKADFLGYYKTGLQLLPREPEEVPEELSEVSDLQDLLGPAVEVQCRSFTSRFLQF